MHLGRLAPAAGRPRLSCHVVPGTPRGNRRSSPQVAVLSLSAPSTSSHATQAQVEHELLHARAGTKAVPLVLYFSATRCGPCKLVSRHVEQLRVKYVNKVKILTVDIDLEKELAANLGIRQIPSLLFIGDADPKAPAILAQGNVTVKLLSDVLDNKIMFAGADCRKAVRLM